MYLAAAPRRHPVLIPELPSDGSLIFIDASARVLLRWHSPRADAGTLVAVQVAQLDSARQQKYRAR